MTGLGRWESSLDAQFAHWAIPMSLATTVTASWTPPDDFGQCVTALPPEPT
jgi:hypothetical protein